MVLTTARCVAAATGAPVSVDGAAVSAPRSVVDFMEVDVHALLRLCMFRDSRLVSLALELLRIEFQQNRILISALAGVAWTASEPDRVVFVKVRMAVARAPQCVLEPMA